MQFDMTKTGTLLKKVELIRPVNSLLVDTYFPYSPANMSLTDKVYFDVKKGGRKISPMVSAYGKTKELTRDKYSTDEITPPLIGLSRSITPDTVANRIAGESVFSGGLTPDQRAAIVEAEDIKDIRNAIVRRREHMVRQLFLTGKVTVIADFDDPKSLGDKVEIDYGMSSDMIQTYSGTDLWTNSGSDPYEHLIAARRKINERSGLVAKPVFIGATAWKALRNHASFKEKFTQYNEKYNFGELAPIIKSSEIVYLGRINEAGLDLYMYDGYTYNPTTGLSEPIIPDDSILMLPNDFSEAFSMQYGGITLLDKDERFKTIAQPLVPVSFIDQRNNVKGIQILSRCVPVIHIIDSFYKAKVV